MTGLTSYHTPASFARSIISPNNHIVQRVITIISVTDKSLSVLGGTRRKHVPLRSARVLTGPFTTSKHSQGRLSSPGLVSTAFLSSPRESNGHSSPESIPGHSRRYNGFREVPQGQSRHPRSSANHSYPAVNHSYPPQVCYRNF